MKKGNEGTDRGNNTDRRQHKGCVSSWFGKTFVLTYRIAYLITELFVEPSSIVALTFTNKAASQMKHRLWKIKNIHWVGLHLIHSRNMSGQKLNCRLFLRLNKNMILIIQRMPKMFWMP
ncbi:MAG: UvrD-helicase domain-containing protein [Lachnospira sp.]|nr:UvrD-helicase domain-containing protein [Lachnospira sp.]